MIVKDAARQMPRNQIIGDRAVAATAAGAFSFMGLRTKIDTSFRQRNTSAFLERARVNVKTSKTAAGRSLSIEVPAASRSLSVSACNGISGSSQILSQFRFHLDRCFKRHRVQVLVKLWHQSHSIFPDDPSRFVAVFVIFESVIDRESCHSDVNAGLQRIAFRVQLQNGRMLCDGVAQQNHINVMVKRLFVLRPSCLPFQFAKNYIMPTNSERRIRRQTSTPIGKNDKPNGRKWVLVPIAYFLLKFPDHRSNAN